MSRDQDMKATTASDRLMSTQDTLLDALNDHKRALSEAGMEDTEYGKDVRLCGRILADIASAAELDEYRERRGIL